jgi:hypothetical protein
MSKSIYITVALLTILGFGFSASSSYAQGVVAGTVINLEGAPVEGAEVMIRTAVKERGQQRFRAVTETNQDGRYTFEEVPVGNYLIRAITADDGGQRKLIELEEGQELQINFQIQHDPQGDGDCDEDGPHGPGGENEGGNGGNGDNDERGNRGNGNGNGVCELD